MSTQASPRPGRGWAWFPWAIAGYFGVVIAVNGAMFWFAKSSFPGVAASKPYEVGVAYNSVLARVALQEAQGWRMTVRADGRRLIVALTLGDGMAFEDVALTGALRRPVGPSEAIDLTFARGDDGVRHADQPIPAPGQWDVTLIARAGDAVAFSATRRLVAP